MTSLFYVWDVIGCILNLLSFKEQLCFLKIHPLLWYQKKKNVKKLLLDNFQRHYTKERERYQFLIRNDVKFNNTTIRITNVRHMFRSYCLDNSLIENVLTLCYIPKTQILLMTMRDELLKVRYGTYKYKNLESTYVINVCGIQFQLEPLFTCFDEPITWDNFKCYTPLERILFHFVLDFLKTQPLEYYQ